MGELLKGKGYIDGVVEAEAIVSQRPFGFWQGIDALVNRKTEPMIIVGSVLAQECYQTTIPVLDQLDPDPFATVKSGDIVRVDGKAGTLEIVKRKNEGTTDH